MVGVVHGVSASARDIHAVAIGLLSLGIGFGLWWVYFDLVGRQRPKKGRNSLPVWMVLHLPLTMAIATAGATLTGVIEHAEDLRAPAMATWVLAGLVGIALATIAAMVRTLEAWVRHRAVYLPAAIAMSVFAVGSAGLGLLSPSPAVLVLTLLTFLLLVWCVYLLRWLALRRGSAAKRRPGAHEISGRDPGD